MQNITSPRKTFSAVLLGIAAISLASAQDQQNWNNPAGGDFGLPANWDTAVPALGDLARFDLGQSGYTVQLDQNRSIGTLQVATDNVTLDLGGFNLNLTDPIRGDWSQTDDYTGTTSLMIGRGTSTEGEIGSLTINGGGTFTTEGITLGGTPTSTGTLIVEGAGTVFNSLGSVADDPAFGFRGNAVFTLQGGAVANFDRLTLTRHGPSTTANVTVQGAGTQLNFNFLDISLRGQSHVVIRDGAHLHGVDGNSSNGRVDLTRNNGSLTIDNATASIGRTRVAFHSSSTNELRVINGGELEINDSLTVASSNSAATGTVRVDGAGSQLSTTTGLFLGGSGVATGDDYADGNLLITNGGEVHVGTNIKLWSSSTIHVEGGSSLTVGTTFDGAEGGTIKLVLRSGEYDALITTGGATAINGFVLDLTAIDGFTADLNDTFILFDYGSTLTGIFADLNEGDIITVGDYEFQLSYGSGNNGVISLNVTAIPEPGMAAAFVAALALFFAITRLRK